MQVGVLHPPLIFLKSYLFESRVTEKGRDAESDREIEKLERAKDTRTKRERQRECFVSSIDLLPK